jgi:serine/threonine protein kinase
MELVEGITLAERIGEGPIPLDEALGIARQIAAALEEAHEKGSPSSSRMRQQVAHRLSRLPDRTTRSIS